MTPLSNCRKTANSDNLAPQKAKSSIRESQKTKMPVIDKPREFRRSGNEWLIDACQFSFLNSNESFEMMDNRLILLTRFIGYPIERRVREILRSARLMKEGRRISSLSDLVIMSGWKSLSSKLKIKNRLGVM